MAIQFPPHNPGAYNVPQDLFSEPLPLFNEDDFNLGGLSNRSGDKGDYASLWNHFIKTYWAEVFDNNTLKEQNSQRFVTSRSKAINISRVIFEEQIISFEDDFIPKQYAGLSADAFYKNNGSIRFSDSRRLNTWEEYLRSTEIGNESIGCWEAIAKG